MLSRLRILPEHSFDISLAPALLLIAALGVTVGALAAGRGASGQPEPELSFDAGTPGGCAEVGVGDELEIALVITDVEELQAWEATITHDFDVIRILEQNVRIFLAQGGGQLIEGSEPLPDINGRHLLAIGGGSAVSVSGSGILATIKFKAFGAGVSIIDIPQNDFDGNGTVDEGAVLFRNGGTKIGDINDDNFFDGSVQSARVAVNASCAAPTQAPTDPPTPNPASPSPSSSATATPATATPTQSAGPTTPTVPPASTVETPPGGFTATWGDNDCSGQVNPVDALFVLRGDAGLAANTGDCPDMGREIEVIAASPHIWGDVDCGDELTPVDSLKLLRFDVGLGVAQAAGCPLIGAGVTIAE
jgi:hypothetical protein